MYRDYTYIVTGCTGHVGNVLTKKLLADGCRVIGLARNQQKAEQVYIDLKPEFVWGDVMNKEDVDRLFINANENFVVIHTVAMVSIGGVSQDKLIAVNVGGTQNIVDACVEHKVHKLLHISSTEALPRGLKLEEDLSNYVPEPSQSRKGYPRTKSMADALILDAVKNRGLNASLLLFADILGPDDYTISHMTQLFMDYIEGRLPASIKGGYNDFDIRDVADCLDKIVENSKSGEAYLFGSEPHQINDMLNIISQKLGTKKLMTLPLWIAYLGAPFLSLSAKLSGKRPLYTASALAILKEDADFPITKAVKEFGYNPRPLKDTVCDQVDFLIDKGMVKI